MRKPRAFLLALLPISINIVSAKEPIFILIKIDGPVHNPTNNTFWYGPFSEGVAVFGVDHDGNLDIACEYRRPPPTARLDGKK